MDIIKKIALQGFSISVLALGVVACGGGSDDPAPAANNNNSNNTSGFTVKSTAFVEGAKIPTEYACVDSGGMNRSVPLSWTNVPANTSKFAVIMDDEIAPCGTGDAACKHWSVYNIPSAITSFTTGEVVTNISGVVVGKQETSEGVIAAYSGMCPPSKHTYKITAYALKDTMPNIAAGSESLTRSQFKTKYSSHILSEATLSGTFDPSAP